MHPRCPACAAHERSHAPPIHVPISLPRAPAVVFPRRRPCLSSLLLATSISGLPLPSSSAYRSRRAGRTSYTPLYTPPNPALIPSPPKASAPPPLLCRAQNVDARNCLYLYTPPRPHRSPTTHAHSVAVSTTPAHNARPQSSSTIPDTDDRDEASTSRRAHRRRAGQAVPALRLWLAQSSLRPVLRRWLQSLLFLRLRRPATPAERTGRMRRGACIHIEQRQLLFFNQRRPNCALLRCAVAPRCECTAFLCL
jgi:hypothetical protein